MKRMKWIAIATGLTTASTSFGQLFEQSIQIPHQGTAPLSTPPTMNFPQCGVPAQVADDFTLGSPAVVTGISWWAWARDCALGPRSEFGGADTIVISFYSNTTDSMGRNIPDSEIASYAFSPGTTDIEQIATARATDPASPHTEFTIYQEHVDLTTATPTSPNPLGQISAGETIWISITANSPDEYFWAEQGTALNGTTGKARATAWDSSGNATGWVFSPDLGLGGVGFTIEGFEAVSDALTTLVDSVQTLNVRHGIANSLDAKLDAAINALIDEMIQNDVAAIGALEAFISATQAQSGHQIPTLDADNLIEQAEQIILFILSQ